PRAGALLLQSGSACHARDGLGHALPARAGMGLLPRSEARRRGARAGDGGVSMAEFIIKMPDVGEGVAEAELVEWHVKVGDLVREDTILAAVMTDKATVDIPSPVEGTITWLGAEIGDTVAVGSPLVKIGVAGSAGQGAGADERPARGPDNAAGATGVTSPEVGADSDTPTPNPSPQVGGVSGEPGTEDSARSSANADDINAPSSVLSSSASSAAAGPSSSGGPAS